MSQENDLSCILSSNNLANLLVAKTVFQVLLSWQAATPDGLECTALNASKYAGDKPILRELHPNPGHCSTTVSDLLVVLFRAVVRLLCTSRLRYLPCAYGSSRQPAHPLLERPDDCWVDSGRVASFKSSAGALHVLHFHSQTK